MNKEIRIIPVSPDKWVTKYTKTACWMWKDALPSNEEIVEKLKEGGFDFTKPIEMTFEPVVGYVENQDSPFLIDLFHPITFEKRTRKGMVNVGLKYRFQQEP